MELNVLPRAKLLSPKSTNNVSQTSNQTTSQTVNVILPKNESNQQQNEKIDSVPNEVNPYSNLEPGEVKYDPDKNKSESKTRDENSATIEFLKLVISAYANNPIKINEYVICTDLLLSDLIHTLTGCDEVRIDKGDIEVSCCGSKTMPIIPISKIWTVTNGSAEVFKYKYSQFIQVFEDYHISLKFIYVEEEEEN